MEPDKEYVEKITKYLKEHLLNDGTPIKIVTLTNDNEKFLEAIKTIIRSKEIKGLEISSDYTKIRKNPQELDIE